MVLNLYKIINKTDGDYVILSNDENSDDNYSDRSLVVEGRWNAILRKQRVNGSKDFYLTVSKSQAVFTCNGSFADADYIVYVKMISMIESGPDRDAKIDK
ncbi:5850_t:CDS:2 [Paraglomus brasilianum]|uniref:5850_t:CDS:1 n=1 Tax=Paraglomus brasilianum TaxID=144538 RepID=A0A9N9GVR2_9GLOM|nr:5850_t:CDS:2 [Paraglomus brasilianum]